jgi:hypothetical protein
LSPPLPLVSSPLIGASPSFPTNIQEDTPASPCQSRGRAGWMLRAPLWCHCPAHQAAHTRQPAAARHSKPTPQHITHFTPVCISRQVCSTTNACAAPPLACS